MAGITTIYPIPAGTPGIQGPGIYPRGIYNPAADDYVKNTVVAYGPKQWLALRDLPAGTTPLEGPDWTEYFDVGAMATPGLNYAPIPDMEAGTGTDKPANAEGTKAAIDAQRPKADQATAQGGSSDADYLTALGGTYLVNANPITRKTLGRLPVVADGGSTDNTSAFTSFISEGGGFITPASSDPTSNFYSTNIAQSGFGTFYSFFGAGRVRDSDGNLRAPIYMAVSSAPAQLGSYNNDSILTAFNADFSKAMTAMEVRVTGAATLGQPTSGYLLTRNAFPDYHFVFLSGTGHNESVSGNGGRTGFYDRFGDLAHYAQGDASVYGFKGFVAGSKPGATNFLANPAISALSGGHSAGASGVYLQGIGDIDFEDGGYDIASIFAVTNMERTNSTGALNVTWLGARVQSSGTKAIDAFYSGFGPTGFGIDLVGATYPAAPLASCSIASGGTGYVVGEAVTVSGGTYQTQTVLKVLTVDGGGAILTFGIDRAGKYSVSPTTPNSVTGGTGSGATFNVSYAGGGVAIAMRANSYIFVNASHNNSVFSSGFPATAVTGTSFFGWDSALSAFKFVANNTSALQIYSNQVLLGTGLPLGFGSRSRITSPADGQLDFTNAASSAGIGLDFSTDGLLKIRNRGQNADMSIQAAQMILAPTSTAPTLSANGQITVEFTSNTTLTFKGRGSDGTTRAGTITLS